MVETVKISRKLYFMLQFEVSHEISMLFHSKIVQASLFIQSF